MKNFLVFLFTVLFVFGFIGSASSAPVQWSENGNWYEAVAGQYTWDQAEQSAASMGGHLATLTSAAENDFVWSLGDNLYKYWLGGYRVSDNGTVDYPQDDSWGWITGEPWEWTNWASGKPNEYYDGNPPENRLNFFHAGDGTWNDAPLTQEIPHEFGFIVEFENYDQSAPIPNPEPTTLLLLSSGVFCLGRLRKRIVRQS
jgi:hypothetical protein